MIGCDNHMESKEGKTMSTYTKQNGYVRFISLVNRMMAVATGMGHDVAADDADTLGCLADAVSGNGDIDVTRDWSDMSGADFANLMSMTRRSQNGRYQLVHYDQIAAYNNKTLAGTESDGDPFPMWTAYDGLLTELRGIVIDVRDMSVASLPYYKFRNMGECDEYSEDAVNRAIAAHGGRFVATEKMDGSLVQMRYVGDGTAFPNGVLFSTSNTISSCTHDAENTHLHLIRTRYMDTDVDSRYVDAAMAYADWTLCLELVYPPEDAHVVQYDRSRWGLWLHGMRYVNTGMLASHDVVKGVGDRFGIPVVPVVASDDMDTVHRLAHDWRGTDHEGMVLDIGGWLVKVKCEDFLRLSYMAHTLSAPETENGFRMIEHAMDDGTIDDLVAAYPDSISDRIDDVIDDIARFRRYAIMYVEDVRQRIPDGCENVHKWVATESGVPKELHGLVFMGIDAPDANELSFFAYDVTSHGERTRQVLSKADFGKRMSILEKEISR
jgi:hypothetical protein